MGGHILKINKRGVEDKHVRDGKFLRRGWGASIPESRVDHSLTNLGFNELPHLTNQNIFPYFPETARTSLTNIIFGMGRA